MEHCYQTSRHALEILPIDCWQFIFNHLGDDQLEAAILVCKDFQRIFDSYKDSLQVVHSEVWMLSNHLKRFKNLKRIDLRQFRGDLKEAILEIGQSDQVSLDVLDILNPYYLAEALKELGSNSKLKNLKTLNCKGVKALDDNDLVVIANFFPNLEQLELPGNNYSYPREHSQSKLTDYGVGYAASKLKLLKKIHMSGSHCVSDGSVVALSLNCAFLKAVEVYNYCSCNGGVTEAGIGNLLRNSPNLEALSIGYIEMDTTQSAINIENSISHAKSLNSLIFSRMDVSDMLLSAIAKANLPLKKFGLKCLKKFTVEGLLMVLSNYQLSKLCIHKGIIPNMELVLKGDTLVNLTHIDISYLRMTNSTILFLLSTKCPLLKEIRMEHGDYAEDLYGLNDIPILSANHNVQNIYLRCSRVDDEWVKQLALLFPNIRVLDLSECRRLTSTGIESILKSCKFITKLMLFGYREAKLIKDNSKFPRVINLEDLDLSCSYIKDEGLSAIAEKCPQLVSLKLKSCPLVTIEGIKNIVKKVTSLKCISIRSNYAYGGKYHKVHDFLEWMLSTSNVASLKKIYVGGAEKYKEKFLQRGCLLL